MHILLLGGTGAMGLSLVDILATQGHDVYVTSRKHNTSIYKNIHYFQGNAHDEDFFNTILGRKYDAIVDFMVYAPQEFKNRIEKMLKVTEQYLFLSSSRVYANSKTPITENSRRLLDVCTDGDYLDTNEYALAKAREENMLIESGQNNWTIIRPYITYNRERLQLGGCEKEEWLWRALNGNSIIIPREVAECRTTMTFGGDVANAMSKLIGNKNAMGQAFHITGVQSLTWKEVADIYCKVIEIETGKKSNISVIDRYEEMSTVMNNEYQIQYDRMYNRIFDNSKIIEVCGEQFSFTLMQEGLTRCLQEFLKNPQWGSINIRLEAWMDKKTGEKTPLSNLLNTKERLKYLGYLYTPGIATGIKKLL